MLRETTGRLEDGGDCSDQYDEGGTERNGKKGSNQGRVSGPYTVCLLLCSSIHLLKVI